MMQILIIQQYLTKFIFYKKDFKYFIGSKDNEKKPLCVMLPKMNRYRKNSNETKYMFFQIKDDELLKKYNETCDQVSNSIRKGFDTAQVFMMIEY